MINSAYALSETSKSAAVDFSVVNAILSASWPVQATLFVLILMSVVSWAIIFTKRKSMNRSHESNRPFVDAFWNAGSLDEIYAKVDKHPDSPIARVFRAGYLELRKIADSNLAKKDKDGNAPLLSGLDNLERALRKAMDVEVAKMESRIGFLATTGSTGPFIGLFGTVWGIMGAFHKIGATNMANLAIVAPGISEALVATAIGLAAAIPATAAYNHFVTMIRREEIEMNSFSSDFLNIVKRNFFQEK
jgi:biopolymer transport protein TolQ